MDFDDLDDEIEKRVADGEDVACRVIENNQPVQGTVLPLMTRSNLLPSLNMHLSKRAQNQIPPWNGKEPTQRKPVLRLLCIHGAADNYEQDWYILESEAPPDIEVAMYEYPGHGHRKEEPFFKTLQELADECFEAFREPMDTGSFALLGHSIGCQIATIIAKRAREELGVEPLFVFMQDRGAVNHPLFTDGGAEYLRNDPIPFFKFWNPLVYTLYEKMGDAGKETLDMWAVDQIIDQETLEIGFYEFKCPILAMQASQSVDYTVTINEQPADMMEMIRNLQKVSPYKKPMGDGKFFMGHFPAWTYDDWSQWTKHPDGATVVKVPDSTHMSIKESAWAKSAIWEALRKIIDTFRSE